MADPMRIDHCGKRMETLLTAQREKSTQAIEFNTILMQNGITIG